MEGVDPAAALILPPSMLLSRPAQLVWFAGQGHQGYWLAWRGPSKRSQVSTKQERGMMIKIMISGFHMMLKQRRVRTCCWRHHCWQSGKCARVLGGSLGRAHCSWAGASREPGQSCLASSRAGGGGWPPNEPAQPGWPLVLLSRATA